MLIRLLCVILSTLLAGALIDGLTVGIGVAAVMAVVLLVSATALLRQGRRLEIALSNSAPTPGRTR